MSNEVQQTAAPKTRRTLHDRLTHILSNFRLSLTFRISLHYCWQLFRLTLTTLLIITLTLSCVVLASVESDIDRLRTASPDAENAFTQMVIQDGDIRAFFKDEAYAGNTLPFLDYRIARVDWANKAPLLTAQTLHAQGKTLQVEFALKWPFTAWCWIMGAAVLCDLIRMTSFIKRRERLHRSVLSPIHDITDMAATLSASNLSNRINIAGTKNELKDLATVINSMLDRIERSYNSQKQFVSDASHELRTPIAVLQGYVNMLQRWGKSDPEVLDEGISAIAQETANMKELVESLLFLARHDKKTLMMEMTQFDALEVATELHREAAMVTPDDTFILSPADSCVVEADRGMIKQVMRILCDNAVKYTPKGGVITIGISSTEERCVLSVTDNGPGIPADELPKIFDRFYRSDTARKSEGGGHGLGLSIARIIVMAHGGKLRVRSKVGIGSTFEIELPLKQSGLHTANLTTTTGTATVTRDV